MVGLAIEVALNLFKGWAGFSWKPCGGWKGSAGRRIGVLLMALERQWSCKFVGQWKLDMRWSWKPERSRSVREVDPG